MSLNLLVIRPPEVPEDLQSTCNYLTRHTHYWRGCEDNAPDFTDCLTAVAYIFRNIKRWELDWIANMPRKLLSAYDCKVIPIQDEMCPGDLVFFAKLNGETRHVGIAVGPKEIFHNSKIIGKGCIEPVVNLLRRVSAKTNLPIYYKIIDEVALLSRIDQRTNEAAINAAMFRENSFLAKRSMISAIMTHPAMPDIQSALAPSFSGLLLDSDTSDEDEPLTKSKNLPKRKYTEHSRTFNFSEAIASISAVFSRPPFIDLSTNSEKICRHDADMSPKEQEISPRCGLRSRGSQLALSSLFPDECMDLPLSTFES